MTNGDMFDKASRFFPTLSKDLDTVSMSELVRDMLEFDAMSSELNTDVARTIDNSIYSKLERKVLETISPILKRYGLRYTTEGRRRYLRPDHHGQFRIQLLILENGFELQPKYFPSPEDSIGIFFPERPSDRPKDYRSHVNLQYKSLQRKVYDVVEAGVDAIEKAEVEIARYPEIPVKIGSAKKSVADGLDNYRIFEKYDVWSYMVGRGFRTGGDGVVTSDGNVEKIW